jgi:microcystin-dependent protein
MRYFSFNSAVKKWQPATVAETSAVEVGYVAGVTAPIQAQLDTNTPVGMLAPFAGAAAPTGWLLCAGQTVPRLGTYAKLFSVISTTYNTGGEAGTDFRLPDLRGRVIAGKDNMGGTTASRITAAVSGVTGTTLGAAGGDERLHQHTHPNTVAGTFATSDHGHGPGSFHAAIGATDSDPSRIGYVAGYNSGGPGTATYSIIAGGLTINTSPFNHYTPVYGGSGGPSATSTTAVSITNASNAQTGASQNLPPTIVLNYIIKI